MKQITLAATVENVDEVIAFIDGLLDENDCPMKTAMAIDIAAEEIFVNIAHYAYAPEIGEATVSADIKTDSGEPVLSLTFADHGVKYNPLERPDPDITLGAEERSIGGLGIFMVKKSMDNVYYEYRGGMNIFTLEKKLS